GAQAAARSAHVEATVCFEQAIQSLRHLPASREVAERTIDLRFDVRQSCVPLLDYRRALEHLREAAAESEAIGDRARLGWTFVFRAHSLFVSGDTKAALEAAQHGVTIAKALDDPGLAESANLYLGQVLHWVGEYRRCAALLGQNVTTLESELRSRHRVSQQFVNSRLFLAWALAELGEFTKALAWTDEAVAQAEAVDRAYWLVHACCGSGLVHLRRGVFDQASLVAERAVELCRGRDFAALWAMPAAILGAAYAHAGRFTEAIQLLTRAAEIASVLGAPILGFLGEAYLLAGRSNEALAIATRAFELSRERAERGWQAWSLRLLGDVRGHGERPDVDSAEDAYRQAVALAGELEMRPLVAHCQLGLGTLYRGVDKPQRALEHLIAAIEMFRDLGMSWWLKKAEHEKTIVAEEL